MTTISRIRTDYESNLHIEVDTAAKVLDCFLVMLPPYLCEPGMLVHREGADMNELWADALALVTHLRAQPWREVHPPNIFRPFAVIVARSFEEVWREFEVDTALMLCSTESLATMAKRYSAEDIRRLHEERVARLCRALEILRGAPRPPAIPWPAFEGLN
jgi:hypothetical protein